jgi:rhodanese-related sulfurtransferase
VEFVAKQIADNKTIIVDSRPNKTKFVKGHVPTAINIPFTQFKDLNGKLPRGLDTPIIFYCGGLKCRLSHKSATAAIEMGYTNVTVFSTGYPSWKQAYGQSKEAVQVAAGEVEGTIDLKKFQDIIANNPESILLIDVRDPDEFAAGSFKTAINIPVDQLEAKIKDFPDDKPIVYFCATGARSGEAFYMTLDVRESLKNVFYVEAEMEFRGDGKYTVKKPH